MLNKRWILVAGLVVAAAVGALLALDRSGTASATSSIARGGTHLSRAATAQMKLQRRDTSDVFLLSTAQGRSYYRLVRDDGTLCYGVGPAGSPKGPDTVECFPDGPPAVIDFSVYEQSVTDPAIHVWRLEGLVNSGDVTRIGIVPADGSPAIDVPVVNNVYYLPAPPQTQVAEVDAYNSQGAVVSSSKIGPGPATPSR